MKETLLACQNHGPKVSKVRSSDPDGLKDLESRVLGEASPQAPRLAQLLASPATLTQVNAGEVAGG